MFTHHHMVTQFEQITGYHLVLSFRDDRLLTEFVELRNITIQVPVPPE